MRIFLTGATGAIGERLLPQLIVRGHEVTATTLSPHKVAQLRAYGARPVILDGLDAPAVREAVMQAQPEVIIHEMTSLSGVPDMRHFDRWFAVTNRLRTEGTKYLLAAARTAGVKRVVAQSYTGWTNGRKGDIVTTEDAPLDTEPLKNQRETLAAIRFVEETIPTAPIDGIVLRYGSLYGPKASESLVDLIQKRRLPIIGSGSGVWSWLHVDDAAAATVAAVEHGAPGIYNIVDDEPAPVSEWLPHLAACLGAKEPLHLPVWLGRLLAGEVVAIMMTKSRGASNAKAKAELGWQPTWKSWREGFRDGLVGPIPAVAGIERTASDP